MSDCVRVSSSWVVLVRPSCRAVRRAPRFPAFSASFSRFSEGVCRAYRPCTQAPLAAAAA
nr:MAG TPA: hypothetical protein [Caudoviricetes sp.]